MGNVSPSVLSFAIASSSMTVTTWQTKRNISFSSPAASLMCFLRERLTCNPEFSIGLFRTTHRSHSRVSANASHGRIRINGLWLFDLRTECALDPRLTSDCLQGDLDTTSTQLSCPPAGSPMCSDPTGGRERFAQGQTLLSCPGSSRPSLGRHPLHTGCH